eukprot:jgi/Mesvir1/13343/Mv15947-RA.1
MGANSSSPRKFSRRRSSPPFERVQPHSKAFCANQKDVCNDPEASTRAKWVYPGNSEWTTASFGRLDSEQSRGRVMPYEQLSDMVASLSRKTVLSDWTFPTDGQGLSDSGTVIAASDMLVLLSMLESSLRAGHSTLSLSDLPCLIECRQSIAASRDDVRHCASLLHTLAMRLGQTRSAAKSGSRTPEVELIHLAAFRILEAIPGAELEVVESLLALAQLCRSQGRFRDAVKYFQRLVDTLSYHLGHEHPSLAAALNFLAESQARAGRFNEAEYTCRRAVSVAEASLGPEHLHTQGYRRNLGALRVMWLRQDSQVAGIVERGRWPEAMAALASVGHVSAGQVSVGQVSTGTCAVVLVCGKKRRRSVGTKRVSPLLSSDMAAIEESSEEEECGVMGS